MNTHVPMMEYLLLGGGHSDVLSHNYSTPNAKTLWKVSRELPTRASPQSSSSQSKFGLLRANPQSSSRPLRFGFRGVELVLYYTILYYTISFYTILYHTILYYTILYYIFESTTLSPVD